MIDDSRLSEYYAKYPLMVRRHKYAKYFKDNMSNWISSENETRATELLFKIIGRYIRHWWE